MGTVKQIIEASLRKALELLSHEMEWDSDEQRKAAIEMYLGAQPLTPMATLPTFDLLAGHNPPHEIVGACFGSPTGHQVKNPRTTRWPNASPHRLL